MLRIIQIIGQFAIIRHHQNQTNVGGWSNEALNRKLSNYENLFRRFWWRIARVVDNWVNIMTSTVVYMEAIRLSCTTRFNNNILSTLNCCTEKNPYILNKFALPVLSRSPQLHSHARAKWTNLLLMGSNIMNAQQGAINIFREQWRVPWDYRAMQLAPYPYRIRHHTPFSF